LQISPGPVIAQTGPSVVPSALPVVGPAAPAAPIEPARRVTANRDGGRGDLHPHQQPQRSHSSTLARGRLIDVHV
jgi:hypothetical protein